MRNFFSLADTQPELSFPSHPRFEIFQFASHPYPKTGRHPFKQKSEDQRLSDPDIPVEKGFIWFRVLGCAMVAMREMSCHPYAEMGSILFWAGGGGVVRSE